ncbi:uncharacterized protein B0I36DRAFT_343067 [Microdochium trichocladiopsis]|uniref:Uncharacterized protein n=1 Tax=Microdochium trichocladiopsis TaxID=1682393 RepID=A0A9P9BGW5_9PEZI|nr:uncharacterized protein B0I36DRAFT_343067 [Microdochium trichocladiopsis]KAH7007932.1 hypothetical protein B0I36DRAFT_343067 [Microdochium trichocladiopsis]
MIVRAISHAIHRMVAPFYHFFFSVPVLFAAAIFRSAGATAIVMATLWIAQSIIDGMVERSGGVVLIVKSIFTNDASDGLIEYIVNHTTELLNFTLDVVRPSGVNTKGKPGESPQNQYWELDLKKPENRQAVGAQIQRVLLTIGKIITLGLLPKLPLSISTVNMNIEIDSDFKNGQPPSPTYVAAYSGPTHQDVIGEKWIYINGIGNERVWFEGACRKIRSAFKREVTGVFNRSDGILWDMIQCFGEHSTVEDHKNSKNKLIQRTESSRAAQEALYNEVHNTLWPKDGSVKPNKVVLICHSQGCLLTRLTLQQLVSDYPDDSPEREDMRTKLRVFPFANPSMDWRVVDDGAIQYLGNSTHTTEHFAHRVDFVAMLGVISNFEDKTSGFDDQNSKVFVSIPEPKLGRPAVGHLFGAHYSLDPIAYEDGKHSKLFKALGGNPIP